MCVFVVVVKVKVTDTVDTLNCMLDIDMLTCKMIMHARGWMRIDDDSSMTRP